MAQVVVGTCPQCGRELKAKEHAPRVRMSYTCHCGWHGRLEIEPELIARAEVLRDHGAGRRFKKPPTAWQRLRRWLTAWLRPAR